MTPAQIRALSAKGYTTDQIAEIAECIAVEDLEKAAHRREQNRIRVQNHRARNHRNALHALHKKIHNEISEPKNGTEIAQENLLTTESVKKESIRANKHGTRLPADWRPSEEDRGWATQQGLTATEITNESDRFIDYWIAKPGEKGCKLNWSATWRNWCRSFLERGNRQTSLPLRSVKTAEEIDAEYQVNLIKWNNRHGQASTTRS